MFTDRSRSSVVVLSTCRTDRRRAPPDTGPSGSIPDRQRTHHRAGRHPPPAVLNARLRCPSSPIHAPTRQRRGTDRVDVNEGRRAQPSPPVPPPDEEGGSSTGLLAGAPITDDDVGAPGLRDLLARRRQGVQQALRQSSLLPGGPDSTEHLEEQDPGYPVWLRHRPLSGTGATSESVTDTRTHEASARPVDRGRVDGPVTAALQHRHESWSARRGRRRRAAPVARALE